MKRKSIQREGINCQDLRFFDIPNDSETKKKFAKNQLT